MAATANSLPGGWLESGHGSITVFVKDFRDPLERKKKLILRPWASIKDVKDQLQVVFNVPSHVQKLFFQGRELKNAHNLQQCGIYQDNAVIDFVARRAHNLAMLYSNDRPVDTGGSSAGAVTSTGTSPSKMKRLYSANGLLKSRQDHTTISNGTSSSSGSGGLADLPVANIHPYGAHLLPVSLMKIMHQALQGLALGLAPVLAMDGTGGTYFLKDPSHRNVGCFKPQDEEPFGPNNPRGLVGELGQSGLRRGILSGEACERELAAYLLDRDHFAGVPATSLVEARHPVFQTSGGGGGGGGNGSTTNFHFKMGSLQEFVRHDDVASDIAPSQFSTHQVHKIVLLDMRLLNTDRNDANILVRKRRVSSSSSSTPSKSSLPTSSTSTSSKSSSSSSSSSPQIDYELIPIDHGYCLPQFLEIAWCDWCWFNWPQLTKPLSASDRAYVLSLNPQQDAERLSKKIPLRRACRRNMIIASTLVQKGVRANLVLYEIAQIICRDDLDTPSKLERMCLDAWMHLQKHRSNDNGNSISVPAVSPNVSGSLGAPPCHSSTSIHAAQASHPIPPASAAPVELSAPPRFADLRISIDEIPPFEFGSHAQSPVSNSARSPPGFWASFTPFSADDNAIATRSNPMHPSHGRSQFESGAMGKDTASPLRGHTSFVQWDSLAATALEGAVKDVAKQNGARKYDSWYDDEDDLDDCDGGYYNGNGGIEVEHAAPHDDLIEEDHTDRRSEVSLSFGGDGDKDDFEVLNDALDENLQDEKLFLGVLGRLMDEEIESVRRRRG